MRALVTGAAGFLGGHLVRALAREGFKVRAAVKSSSDRDDWGCRAERIVANVLNREAMYAATRGARIVFHCAAALPGASIDELCNVNVTGTRNVVDGCVRNRVDRLIYVSTDSVYGDASHSGITEEAPLVPDYFLEGLYPRTKLEGEAVAMASHRDGRLAVAVVRPCLMYGPGRCPGNDILRRWANRRAHLLLDGGRAKMSLLHVEDAVAALVAAGRRQQAIGKSYNLSDGSAYARVDILAALTRLTGRRARLVQLPSQRLYGGLRLVHPIARLISDSLDRAFDPHRIAFAARDHVISPAKAIRELGFQPQVSLWEGLSRTMPWLRQPELNPW